MTFGCGLRKRQTKGEAPKSHLDFHWRLRGCSEGFFEAERGIEFGGSLTIVDKENDLGVVEVHAQF